MNEKRVKERRKERQTREPISHMKAGCFRLRAIKIS